MSNYSDMLVNKLEDLKIDEADKERYDYLFEQSKALHPDCNPWIIHICCLEQIEEEKGNIVSQEAIDKVRFNYDDKLEYQGIYFGKEEEE